MEIKSQRLVATINGGSELKIVSKPELQLYNSNSYSNTEITTQSRRMTSSDPMDEDESFRARVYKVFGSLSSSPAAETSPALKPLWSLTDEEVEKREWNRSKEKSGKDDDRTICSSSFDEMLKRNRKGFGKDIEDFSGFDDLEDRSGDEDEDEDGESVDVREIRSSIGLDSTLDNEEEEDEYDRFAEGRGKMGNFLRKDPRADKRAARDRLKEDSADAENLEPGFSETEPGGEKGKGKAMSSDHSKLKPILKRKGNGDARSRKRVRFDSSFVDEPEEPPEKHPERSEVSPSKNTEGQANNSSSFDENKPKVPDYIINPSKYTRYSLDSSSEPDHNSNDQETKDPSSTSTALPKSVSFVPKKKTNGALPMEGVGKDVSKEGPNQQSFPVGIAALEATEEDDDVEMDLDGDVGVCKPNRHYRNKSKEEDPVT